MSNNQSNGGCLSLIVFILLVWALIFGVTWNGKHHGINCSTERGVGID